MFKSLLGPEVHQDLAQLHPVVWLVVILPALLACSPVWAGLCLPALAGLAAGRA